MQFDLEIRSLSRSSGIHADVLEQIRSLASHYHIKKVILFGSRARGNYHSTSDIDLAIDGKNFSEFIFDIDESTNTLLKYDFVNLDSNIQPELRDSIYREGIIIYEEI